MSERETTDDRGPRVLLVDPWYAESHRTLLDGLAAHLPFDTRVAVLPRGRWRWRMRSGAVELAEAVKTATADRAPDVLLATDYVNLPDLVAFCPTLAAVPKVVYFLEDQVTYPVREGREREIEFVAINLTSALLADACIFCSENQMHAFADGLRAYCRKYPDAGDPTAVDAIAAKSCAIPIGGEFAPLDDARARFAAVRTGPLRIVWPHRFEHDKGPDEFFETLFTLADEGLDFTVSAIGRQYRDEPTVFAEAKARLVDRIDRWGFQEGFDYARALAESDVVVSTALQETQGMAVIEAMRAGCEPLLPARLSYPEVLGADAPSHTFRSTGELRRRLRWMIRHPDRVRAWPDHAERVDRFAWTAVVPAYVDLLRAVAMR